MLTEPLDVRILCPGQNWMNVGSLVAVGLNGYDSRLPDGSTIAAITCTPLSRMVIEAPARVAAGEFDMAMISPSWFVSMARAGKGPFKDPLPLASIATFPHDDQFAFAVRKGTNARTLRDVKERQLPLRVALPTPSMAHTVGWIVDEIFAQHGFSREDVVHWGGEVIQDHPRALIDPAAHPIDPSFDGVFDEALMAPRWDWITEQYEMEFLSIDDETLAACASAGLAPAILRQGRLRGVTSDVQTIDAGGWDIYCAEDMPYELGYLTAAAIDKQHEAITARSLNLGMTSPVDMRRVCNDVPVPLHAGAAAYYEEHGYLERAEVAS